jgi:hypothetical protein
VQGIFFILGWRIGSNAAQWRDAIAGRRYATTAERRQQWTQWTQWTEWAQRLQWFFRRSVR